MNPDKDRNSSFWAFHKDWKNIAEKYLEFLNSLALATFSSLDSSSCSCYAARYWIANSCGFLLSLRILIGVLRDHRAEINGLYKNLLFFLKQASSPWNYDKGCEDEEWIFKSSEGGRHVKKSSLLLYIYDF